MHISPPGPGQLVSVEGVSGVGKTHLITSLLADWPAGEPPLLLEEFSQRPTDGHHDLGRDLLRVLLAAADGDPFLRSGHPGTETLLLLAIKTYDYEHCREILTTGRTVIEGRSLHTIAVYQALILHPGDDAAAYDRACDILYRASRWRPLPDLTIYLRDDVTAAGRRAEHRDRMRFTAEHWQLHHRAAALFDRLAADAPTTTRVVDLQTLPTQQVLAELTGLFVRLQRQRPGHGIRP